MLTVTKNDIAYISYSKSVNQDRTCVYGSCYLCALVVKLQNISGCKNKDILFRNSQFFYYILLGCQMSVFTMNRNCIFRFNQRIDQFDFLLACMSGNMNILEDNFCTLHGKFIDNLGYRFLISRNRIGTENNRIIRFNHDFLVDIRCHTGKRSHRFTLASCCNQHYLLIRIILNLIDLNQGLIRNAEISKLCCSSNNIYHAAAFHCNLTTKSICCIDDLLYTVYIRRKSRDNNSVCLIFIKEIIEYMSNRTLRHRKSTSLSICTVAHQCQYTFLADLGKTLQINSISKYRCVIHFKVTCMHYDTCR